MHNHLTFIEETVNVNININMTIKGVPLLHHVYYVHATTTRIANNNYVNTIGEAKLRHKGAFNVTLSLILCMISFTFCMHIQCN